MAKGKENRKPTVRNNPVKRAVWNSSCDAILIEVLEKEKADGRMTSNSSWHSAAWIEAEKALAGTEEISGGIKKTADSCHNRWAALKKEYAQVALLRGKSGFGWDDANSLVTATDEVWNALLETAPTLKKWRKVGFPLYDSMHELVHGTIATGASSFHPGRDFTPPSDASPLELSPSPSPDNSQTIVDLLHTPKTMSNVIFLTGASGYLGSHVVSHLLDKGYHVKAAARGKKAEAFQFQDALVGVDAVIHVASPLAGRADPRGMLSSAIEGSLNVLRQAEKAGVKKFVVTSSVLAADGDPTMKGSAFGPEHWNPVTKEEALQSGAPKVDVYSAAKKYAELAVWEWAEAHPHVDVTTIVPSVIYGPFPSKSAPFPKPDFDRLSTALMMYNLLFPTGAYLPTYKWASYVDGRDVARAHVGALDSKPDKNAKKRIIISSPYGLTNRHVLDLIKKEHPELETRFITAPVPDCPPVSIDADFKRLEEVTGLRKEDFRTLEQTISDSVNDLLRLENEWKKNGYTVTEVPRLV